MCAFRLGTAMYGWQVAAACLLTLTTTVECWAREVAGQTESGGSRLSASAFLGPGISFYDGQDALGGAVVAIHGGVMVDVSFASVLGRWGHAGQFLGESCGEVAILFGVRLPIEGIELMIAAGPGSAWGTRNWEHLRAGRDDAWGPDATTSWEVRVRSIRRRWVDFSVLGNIADEASVWGAAITVRITTPG